MGSELLDELTVDDQRSLALTELTPFLEQVTPDAQEVTIWLRVWEWLKQKLFDSDTAQNQWLDAFGQWLARNGQFVEYFFYLSAAATVAFGFYLLYRVVKDLKQPQRKAAQSSQNYSPVPEMFQASDDPVVQAYGQWLQQLEQKQLIEQPFTLSPREIASSLNSQVATSTLAKLFTALFPDIDRYLYSANKKNSEVLLKEIERMQGLTSGE